MTRHGFLSAAGGGLAILAGLLVPASTRLQAQDTRTVTVTARRFEFSPNQITLVRGETVRLQVRSEDVTHGLFVRPLGIDLDIAPDRTTEVTVTPQQAGTYRAICDHFCGAGHGGMKMTILVVEPASGTPAAP